MSVVQVGSPVSALILLDAAGSAIRGLQTVEGRSSIDIVRSSNSVTMTRYTTRVNDRIDSANRYSAAYHTPKRIDMADGQAEHDGQKDTLEVPHLDRGW